MCRRGLADSGFTLIEMLVALAVFSLAVLALLNLSGENTRTAVLVQEQVLAGVVADNRAVEALLLSSEELAASSAGTEQAGGVDWHWRRVVSGTDDPGIVRVDVEVMAADKDRLVAQLSVFRSRP